MPNQKLDLPTLLAGNPYPGRGIFIGQGQKEKTFFIAYFIMGRSEHSRNRIFVVEDGELFTRPYDPAKLKDPSLIIYRALSARPGRIFLTNGDQTDTLLAFEKEGQSFDQALMSRSFEPDGPNWTPRISAQILWPEGGSQGAAYELSILKAADPQGQGCLRQFFHYESHPGVGHFLSTYETDGTPLPSFCGEPRKVAVEDGGKGAAARFAQSLWSALDPENKVSLYVRTLDGAGHFLEEALINAQETDGKEQ